MDSCCICTNSNYSKSNPILHCSKPTCGIYVHKVCYGLKEVPNGPWHCQQCLSGLQNVECRLCPVSGGALKSMDTGGWCHVVCALFNPIVKIGNKRYMEQISLVPNGVSKLSDECYICSRAGKIVDARMGFCIACKSSGCKLSFHVTCGLSMDLLAGIPRGKGVHFVGFCDQHIANSKSRGFTIPEDTLSSLMAHDAARHYRSNVFESHNKPPMDGPTSHVQTLPNITEDNGTNTSSADRDLSSVNQILEDVLHANSETLLPRPDSADHFMSSSPPALSPAEPFMNDSDEMGAWRATTHSSADHSSTLPVSCGGGVSTAGPTPESLPVVSSVSKVKKKRPPPTGQQQQPKEKKSRKSKVPSGSTNAKQAKNAAASAHAPASSMNDPTFRLSHSQSVYSATGTAGQSSTGYASYNPLESSDNLPLIPPPRGLCVRGVSSLLNGGLLGPGFHDEKHLNDIIKEEKHETTSESNNICQSMEQLLEWQWDQTGVLCMQLAANSVNDPKEKSDVISLLNSLHHVKKENETLMAKLLDLESKKRTLIQKNSKLETLLQELNLTTTPNAATTHTTALPVTSSVITTAAAVPLSTVTAPTHTGSNGQAKFIQASPSPLQVNSVSLLGPPLAPPMPDAMRRINGQNPPIMPAPSLVMPHPMTMPPNLQQQPQSRHSIILPRVTSPAVFQIPQSMPNTGAPPQFALSTSSLPAVPKSGFPMPVSNLPTSSTLHGSS